MDYSDNPDSLPSDYARRILDISIQEQLENHPGGCVCARCGSQRALSLAALGEKLSLFEIPDHPAFKEEFQRAERDIQAEHNRQDSMAAAILARARLTGKPLLSSHEGQDDDHG